MYKIAHDEHASEIRSIEAVLHDELDKLEQISREGVSLLGTPSGFRDIDDITGGFQGGNLIVLAARPAMGKSALVVNIAENAAVDHGKAVALFSLEMSETELAQRFIASQAKLDGDELRKGRVKPDRWPKVVRATEQLSRAQLFIDDSSDLGRHGAAREVPPPAQPARPRADHRGLPAADAARTTRASAASSRSGR